MIAEPLAFGKTVPTFPLPTTRMSVLSQYQLISGFFALEGDTVANRTYDCPIVKYIRFVLSIMLVTGLSSFVVSKVIGEMIEAKVFADELQPIKQTEHIIVIMITNLHLLILISTLQHLLCD
jgi:hypothetical protein